MSGRGFVDYSENGEHTDTQIDTHTHTHTHTRVPKNVGGISEKYLYILIPEGGKVQWRTYIGNIIMECSALIPTYTHKNKVDTEMNIK